MHCDTDPSAQLGEAVQATLFTHHPYGMPIIGWGHEIEGLRREDALAYYQRFYTPGERHPRRRRRRRARGDAGARRGHLRQGEAARRASPSASARASRRRSRAGWSRSTDDKVEQPNWQRHYLAPSCRTAKPGESEALDVLAHLLGGGQTSLLYRSLVVEEKLAVSAWAYYTERRSTRPGSSQYDAGARTSACETLDKAFDKVIAKFLADGIEPGALERAKTRLVADAIYARDSQSDLARWYGSSLAIGQTHPRGRGMAGEDRGRRRRGGPRRRAPLARPQARRDRTPLAARGRSRLT